MTVWVFAEAGAQDLERLPVMVRVAAVVEELLALVPAAVAAHNFAV